MNRSASDALPNMSVIGAQQENVPCPGCSTEPVMERLMRWVAWGLVLLGTAVGLWEHWYR